MAQGLVGMGQRSPRVEWGVAETPNRGDPCPHDIVDLGTLGGEFELGCP